MTLKSYNIMAGSLALLSPTISAFGGFSIVSSSGRAAFLHLRNPFTCSSPSPSSALHAIIYGWDDDSEEDDIATSATTISSPFYTPVPDDGEMDRCSPVGSLVAESLSRNADKVGSLARLAVAFSPPDRTLTLKDLEQVEVVCVRENSIEIQAIVCEGGGCVSLFVPVQFPQDCGGGDFDSEQWLSGCALSNLEKLDMEAEAKLLDSDQEDDEEFDGTDTEIDFPSWWKTDAALEEDCTMIKNLMNEDDFNNEILALAQKGIRSFIADGGNDYVIRKARVAAVGPSGICLKIRALNNKDSCMNTMNVMVPFGGEATEDGDSLRAAVLGAVAAADEFLP